MTLLLVGIGVTVYLSMGIALLDEIDAGLRFRAAAMSGISPKAAVEIPNARLEEPDEAFDQFMTVTGRVARATPGFTDPLLRPAEFAQIRQPTFFERRVPNVVGTARLLAVPLDSTVGAAVLVVGTTMADRTDALRRLQEVFLIGGPTAVGLACLAGWIVAGLALQPMERMRQQVSAITASGLDRRLTVPPARDEMQRLAQTLNNMLERLDRSLLRERAFLERASHELRTPLAALRAEVDLALRRRRTKGELSAALRGVSQETDRLVRLAEDLLVLARADDGRLPLHRQDLPLRSTLESASALFAARAQELGVQLAVDGPETTISADPLRLRQALVNLIDNALRHTPRGGTIRLAASISLTDVRIAVCDTGCGFAADAVSSDGDSARGVEAPGLGLRIVRAVAASHHGTVRIRRNDYGGATVELVLPHSAAQE